MTGGAMEDREPTDLDLQRLLTMLVALLDRHTVDTEIGRIVMPGPTYLGMWARDTGVVTLVLIHAERR
jgi:hypothetical protein